MWTPPGVRALRTDDRTWLRGDARVDGGAPARWFLLNTEANVTLDITGFVAKLGEERILMTLPTAVQAYAAGSATRG